MKLRFEINSLEDAQLAARACQNIVMAFGGEPVVPARLQRTRTKVSDHAVDSPTLTETGDKMLDAYNAVAAKLAEDAEAAKDNGPREVGKSPDLAAPFGTAPEVAAENPTSPAPTAATNTPQRRM